jgi:hypothetical protein
LSLGARRDYGLSQAQNRLLEPSTIYPTANVRDLVLVEDVLLDAGYTPVLIGTPRKGASNYRLVSQKEADGDGDKQYMRRVWATSQNAQEAHNLSLKYLEGGHAAPTYIRKYTILKSAYAALTAGTPLTAVIGIALTAGGSGYLTAPTVTFSGGSGTGAAAIAQIRDGAVVALLLTAEGTGYVTTPTVAFSGGGGTGATATASIQDQTAILIDQEAVPEQGEMGNLFYSVTRVWQTLPGPATIRYEIDGETQTDVSVTKQMVAKPSAPYTQVAGSDIIYQPISSVHGWKITSTLLNFAGISITKKSTIQIRYPSVVTGSPSCTHFAGKDGSVIVDLNWPIISGGSRQANATTTFSYGAAPSQDSANAYFTPETKDLIFSGLFYNVNLRGVAVNGTVKVPDFTTASNNKKWGYVACVGPTWTGTSGASAFLSAVSNITYSCDIQNWKYNLKRKALTTVTG